MNVRFPCPVCESSVRVDLPGPGDWQCLGCDHLGRLETTRTESLERCAHCGSADLYKKKDFPHRLGLSIITTACLASVIPYWLYHQWVAWAILIGSALFDGLLYLCVGDVTVCYRCDAHHRGWPPNETHRPFELTIQERYRQERIRRELAATAGKRKET